jgi:hypothetical protein
MQKRKFNVNTYVEMQEAVIFKFEIKSIYNISGV